MAQSDAVRDRLQNDASDGAFVGTARDEVISVATPLAVGDALSKRDTANGTVGESGSTMRCSADVARSSVSVTNARTSAFASPRPSGRTIAKATSRSLRARASSVEAAPKRRRRRPALHRPIATSARRRARPACGEVGLEAAPSAVTTWSAASRRARISHQASSNAWRHHRPSCASRRRPRPVAV